MDEFMYREFFGFEKTHWWFQARRHILMTLLKGFMEPFSPTRRILDLGCGAGLTLKSLAHFGKPYGVDVSEIAVHYSRKNSDAPLLVGSLEGNPPFRPSSFHLITMLDILEHIDDDLTALLKVHALLEKDGLLLCTVPAFPSLWSWHDEVNHHRRRYVRAELARKLQSAGFLIQKISYFNCFLFAPVWLRRQLSKVWEDRKDQSDFKHVAPFPNAVLRAIFQSESHWLRRHNFPFGVSLLAVARRQ